jgi:hypothetical protein
MSMQNKPQMVEAVVFFGDQGIRKEMFFAELEAVLDGVVNLPEFADQQMRAAYVLINPRLLIRSVVFFYLDFDERGRADTGWNIPLRHLAERAGRGPDLGAGPIRLACRSQCPVAWHQMHMWDPALSPEHNDLLILREAVKKNRLGILVEDEFAELEPSRLQMASEDKWHTPRPAQGGEKPQSRKDDYEQRQKTAQLLKQQRLRISSLTRQHEEDLARLRLSLEQEQQQLSGQLEALQQALQRQEELNLSLKTDLSAQAEMIHGDREQMAAQLRAAEDNARQTAELLRRQFDSELKAKLAAAVIDYREQMAVRDAELAYRGEVEKQLQEQIRQLRQEHETLARESGDHVLERLAGLGVMFVVYHPGAGHLTIPLQDISRYQDKPLAYAAAKCFVSEAQYSQWLEHYQQPSCEALLSSGVRCGIPIDRIDTPSRFVPGDSNCCSRHKARRKSG